MLRGMPRGPEISHSSSPSARRHEVNGGVFDQRSLITRQKVAGSGLQNIDQMIGNFKVFLCWASMPSTRTLRLWGPLEMGYSAMIFLSFGFLRRNYRRVPEGKSITKCGRKGPAKRRVSTAELAVRNAFIGVLTIIFQRLRQVFQNIRRGHAVLTFFRRGKIPGAAVQENAFAGAASAGCNPRPHGRDAAGQDIAASGGGHA